MVSKPGTISLSSGFMPERSRLQTVLDRALSRDPAGRFQTAIPEQQPAYQAAQTTANYLTWFISSYVVLVSVGSTALVARFTGAGDLARRTGMAYVGLVPFLRHGLPDEDGAATPVPRRDAMRVAVVRYPTASNLDEFKALEDVVEFYDHGVVDNPNLSPPLRNPPGSPNAGQPRRLNLTVAQKAALVAFLKTLTDPNLATDSKLSDPFNYGN